MARSVLIWRTLDEFKRDAPQLPNLLSRNCTDSAYTCLISSNKYSGLALEHREIVVWVIKFEDYWDMRCGHQHVTSMAQSSLLFTNELYLLREYITIHILNYQIIWHEVSANNGNNDVSLLYVLDIMSTGRMKSILSCKLRECHGCEVVWDWNTQEV